MKKSILIIATLLTFLLFSCASDSSEPAEDIIDEISAPEIVQDDEDSIVSFIQNLPEPEDFEEPLVRDLDIPDLPEETSLSFVEPEKTITEINESSETNIIPQNTTTIAAVTTTQNTNTTEANSKTGIPAEIANENSVQTIPVETKNNVQESNNTSTLTSTKPVTSPSSSVKSEQKADNTKVSIPDTKKQTENTVTEKTTTTTQQNKDNTTSNTVNSTQNIIKNQEKEVETEIQKQLVDTETEQIIPSRKVTVNTNETLTITYPGYGWIYLGSETSENNNLVSTGRRVENDETVYTLTAKNPGTQLQHFYKVDTITGDFIDDYIEVSVLDNKGSIYTVVKAPEYAEIVPERPETPAVASSKKTLTIVEIEQKEVKPTEKRSYEVYVPESEPEHKTVSDKTIYSKTPENYSENLNADDLLEKAIALFNEKKYVESQNYLNNFMSIATERRDEGLYLQGQLFEQDGATKNIKESISSYTTLTESYPESIYWDDANKRIIYLNRFYIQIR